MNDQIRSVAEIFAEKSLFVIPNYQRGYKWSCSEVSRLLRDIHSFCPSGERYYCIQNITVVHNEATKSFHIVDGQQRISTLLLILSFFKFRIPDRNEQFDFKLHYDIRPTTQTFLTNEIFSREFWEGLPETWALADPDTKVRLTQFNFWLARQNSDYDHQDIFHFYSAAATIKTFFIQRADIDLPNYRDKLLKHVKCIWNMVPTGITETEIFSKINGFRVPLSGADLLRGIFISFLTSKEKFGTDTEGISLQNEARVRIGLELDAINHWWSVPERKEYFKLFTSIGDEDLLFDADKYPINNLYKLYAESRGEKYITLEFFENPPLGKSRDEIVLSHYEKIKKLHYILVDWYGDREIYHLLGFLFAQTKQPFALVWSLWNDPNYSRTEFIKQLKKTIYDVVFQVQDKDNKRRVDFDEWRKRINPKDHQELRLKTKPADMAPAPIEKEYSVAEQSLAEQEELEMEKQESDAGDSSRFNWYKNETKLKQILTLLEVIRFAKKGENSLPPNMPTARFRCIDEDKEHIFPQTPIADFDLRDKLESGDKREAIRGKAEKYRQLLLSTMKISDTELEIRWKEQWENARDPEFKEIDFPLELNNESYELMSRNEALRNRIQEAFNAFVLEYAKVDINSIGNIVLLLARVNRSYGNHFYTEKRARILNEYNKSNKIRIHTRAIFTKEFAPEDLRTAYDVWNQDFIDANCRSIEQALNYFFENEEN